MAIWNPLIRKYVEIPKEPIEKRSGFEYSSSIALEFGDDLHNHDYKVLRIAEFSNRGESRKEFEVNVYSLRSRSWKKFDYQLPNKEWRIFSDSVCLNGAFHWLVTVVTATGVNNAGLLLSNSPPRNFGSLPIYWRTYLENLKGQLCFLRNMMMYEDVKEWNSDVWLMKEHGDASSWTWNYKIQQHWKPLMFSKNGKKIYL